MVAWKKKRIGKWLDGDTPRFTDGTVGRSVVEIKEPII